MKKDPFWWGFSSIDMSSSEYRSFIKLIVNLKFWEVQRKFKSEKEAVYASSNQLKSNKACLKPEDVLGLFEK